jgi:competence protein ComEC
MTGTAAGTGSPGRHRARGPAGAGRRVARTADVRLVPGALAAWLTAVVALQAGHPSAWLVAAAVAALTGLVLVVPAAAAPWRAQGALVLICAAGAAASSGTRLAAVEQGPVPALARERASVEVHLVVTGDPERHESRTSGRSRSFLVVPARAEQVRAHGRRTGVRSPVVVFATDQHWASLLPSTRVRAFGRLAPARPGEPAAGLLSVRGPPAVLDGPSAVQGAAERFRAGLREAVSGLPAGERGLVPGLVLGDTSRMPAELTEDFRTTGLAHLTAVSGTNVAILLTVALGLVRWLGLRGRAVPLVGACVMAGFVVLVRPQPSVLRASAMGLVAVLALATGRRREGVPALCAAVLALVLIDPWLARSFGFALSVLATAGILVLAPGWRDRLAGRLPEPLAAAVAVPLAAQVACAPVIAMLSAQVSLVAVPANLLAAAAVAPATVLGVLAAVASPWAMPLAVVLGRLAGLPARWIVEVAHRGAELPGAALAWPGGLMGAVTLAAVTLATAVLLPRLARYGGRGAFAVALVVLAVVGLRPVVPGFTPGWPPPGWVLVACDVGQGDALVLSVRPGTAVVVDAGPDPRAVDRCLRDLGVRRIPLVLLSHFHADHVEGLPGVLRGRIVTEIDVSPLAEPAGQAARVRRWAAAAGVRSVRVPAPGERRSVDRLNWQILWPRRLIAGDDGSAPNNASLVVQAEHGGVRVLLTGDIEPPAQDALLASGADLRADFLKVPHHGSAFQSAALVRAVRPRAAIISVGRDNDYGHPAPSALALMASAGARVARTDEHGDVAVVGPRDRLRLVTRHRQPLAGQPSPGGEAAGQHTATASPVPARRGWSPARPTRAPVLLRTPSGRPFRAGAGRVRRPGRLALARPPPSRPRPPGVAALASPRRRRGVGC